MKNYKKTYNEPWNRGVILLQDEHGYNKLTLDEKGKDLFRKNGLIVLKLEDREFEEDFKIVGENQPLVGSLLALSSHQAHTYVEFSEAKKFITQERYSLTMELLQKLGAKKTILKSVSIQETETGANATMTLGTHGVEGNLKTQFATVKNLGETMTMTNSFAGGSPNLAAAEEFIKKHNLYKNIHIQHLFNLVATNANKIQHHNLKFETTESLNKTFEFACGIQWPLNTISASTGSTLKEKTSYNLEIDVEF